jgi:cytidylate kinase
VAPLKPAADAVILDSTGMPITEVIERVLAVLPESLRPR